MYEHSDYKDPQPGAMKDFIEKHPFAVLSGCTKNYEPVATQVPVFLEQQDGHWVVRGHMIRGSEHHKAFAENPKVILVFPGDHAYVSATWYKDPQQASTWNYMSVQVKGEICFKDRSTLIEVLKKTTLHFEKGDLNSPTIYDNLDTNYTGRLLDYIVAFEIRVDHMDHVFKLSQDKDAQSYENIIKELKKGEAGARAIAGEMEKRRR